MSKIIGGALNFEFTADLEKLKKTLDNGKGHLKGFTELAKETGVELDNIFSKAKANQGVDIFGISRENIKIQKQAIEDLKKQIDELQDKAKGTAPGMAQAGILSQIGPLKAELAAEERALIELQTELGKTEQKQISLTTARNQALDAMRKLTLENKQGTDEYKAAEQAVIDYNKAIEQTNAQAKMLSAGGLSGVINKLSIVTGVMSAATSFAALFNSENENLNRIMLKTQALLSVTVTLQQLYQAETKGSGIMAGILSVQEMARARATDMASAATGRATIAQRLFNLVANANPYLLLATGIITVVGAIALYISATNEAEKRTQKLIDLNKAVADSVAGPLIAYRTLQAQWNALGNDLNAKKKFITENKEKFDDLGEAVNSVTQAENLLQKNSEQFVNSMMLRAKAAVLAERAVENMKKSLFLEREYKRKNIDEDLTPWEQARYSIEAPPAERERRRRERAEIYKTNIENLRLAKEQEDLQEEINKINKNANFKGVGDQEEEKNTLSQQLSKKKERLQQLMALGKQESSEYKKILAEAKKIEQVINAVDDQLNPPKNKNKDLGGLGSVTDLRKKLADIDSALEKSIDITKIETLKKRRIAIEEELNEAIQRISTKSLKQQSEEQEKFWAAYNQIAEMSGKDVAKKQYGPLIQGAQSYYDWVNNTLAALEKKADSNILSEQDKEDLLFMQQKFAELSAEKFGMEKFSAGIEEALKNIPTLAGQLEFLAEKQKDLFTTKGNTSMDSGEQKYLADQHTKIKEQIKQNYDEFLKEHQSFEEKKNEITLRYEQLRAEAIKNGHSTDKIDKAQKAETSQLEMDILQSTADWQMAFGDMEFVSQSALKRIEAALLRFKEVMGDTLQPTELRELEEALKRVRDAQTSNPFTSVVSGLRNLKIANDEVRIATEEYNATLDANGNKTEKSAAAANKLAQADLKAAAAKQKLIEDLRESQGIFNAVGEAVIDLGSAFGFMDEETSKAIGNLMELGNAAFDFAASVSSGDVAGMIRAGAKIITSIANLFNDDDKKERNIARYTEELRELERVFESLNRTISKSLGEDYFDVSKQAIDNLRQQQQKLRQMIDEESGKKGADQDKIQGYYNQIAAIDNAIDGMMQSMADKILAGMDAQSIMDKLSDALVSAFENGEDAALAMGRTVDQMLRDMVINALKMQILAPEIKKVVDKIMQSMGYNQVDNSTEINSAQSKLQQLEQELANTSLTHSNKRLELMAQIAALKEYIDKLKAGQGIDGSFDGLTEEEREKIKEMLTNASNQFTNALQQYEDLFGAAAENAIGMKGDIKGITEKTAGALESQINAMRMHQVEMMKTAKLNHAIFVESLKNLVMIEYNTRRLHSIDDGIKELNAKINKKLAGVP